MSHSVPLTSLHLIPVSPVPAPQHGSRDYSKQLLQTRSEWHRRDLGTPGRSPSAQGSAHPMLCHPSQCPGLISGMGWMLQSHPALTPVPRKPFTRYCICPLSRLNFFWLFLGAGYQQVGLNSAIFLPACFVPPALPLNLSPFSVFSAQVCEA